MKSPSVAILYENRDWMQELFKALDEHCIPYQGISLDDGAFILDEPDDHALFINRVSPSSYLRGHGPAIRLATGLLDMLETNGKRVINGAKSFKLETSKVAQHMLVRSLGVDTPYTAVFNNRQAVRSTARNFPYPAILKPDTGGSGAYVRYVQDFDHLEHLLEEEPDLFGPDHLLLLQEFITAADGTIYRTEFVDGEFLFAMRVRPNNTFNLCPADSCERFPSGKPGETGEPTATFEHYPCIPADAVAQAREIVREARLDVGGVEYIETADGARVFYDINATSIYRPDIVEASQVDAMRKFVDFVQREFQKEQNKTVSRPRGNGQR